MSARWTHDDLEEVATSLSAAVATDDIARIVVDGAAAVLRADNAALWLARGDQAVLTRAVGYTDAMESHFQTVPLSGAVPLCDALRGGDVFVQSRAEFAERWPASEQETRALNSAPEIGFACLPLAAESTVMGALSFTFHDARAFDREERSLLRILARNCTVALRRADLISRLRDQVSVNESLHRIGTALASELDIDRLLQRLTDEATVLVRAQFGSFFHNVLNERGESYMLWTLSGVPREAFAKFPMPRNTKIFAPTFRGEGVVRFDDVTKSPLYGQNPPHSGMPEGHLPVCSYLAAPVISRSGEVLGGLFFGHAQPSVFAERDEIAIMTVAAQAAVAIDNARLYRAEQNARKSAEDALRVRDAFLSIASHELKTPVTAVSLQLQALRREAERGELNAERAGRKVALAERSIGRLTSLVDELLDVSRLGAGRLEVAHEPVDLAEVTSEVVARCELLARSAGSTMTLTAAPGVAIGDRQRVDQVVSNLLSNAIKYGNAKPIEISCGIEADRPFVRVRDHGIGVAPEARERIFDRFERAVEDRSASGLGLGLWITKSLVQLMDGDITLESEVGVGSTFTVRFTQCHAPNVTPQPK